MTSLLHICALITGAVLMTFSFPVVAQGKFDFGEREYMSNCAQCHGASGKGDGVLRPYLNKSPSDLTVLSKHNSGVFPQDRIYRVIDGRDMVPLHGERDMPAWGMDYSSKAAQDWQDWPYNTEAYVRSHITALVDYIHRRQEK